MHAAFRNVTVPFENLRVVGRHQTYVLFGTATIAHDGRGSAAPVRFELDAASPGQGPTILEVDGEMFALVGEAFAVQCASAMASAINRDLARGGHLALFGEFRPNSLGRQGRPPYLRRAVRRLPTYQRPREIRIAGAL